MKKIKYYDGHYIDSGLPLEERERLCIEAEQENENLTEWPEED